MTDPDDDVDVTLADQPSTAAQPPIAPPPAAAPAPMPAPGPARSPVSYQPAEPGWWLATDGRWHPPETRPQGLAPPPLLPVPPIVPVVPVVYRHVVVAPPFVPPPPKSKVAAGLLALFLGWLGVHRYYLGFAGVGTVMLLLTVLSFGFLLPITLLWSWIEGIVLLCGGMRDRWGQELV